MISLTATGVVPDFSMISNPVDASLVKVTISTCFVVAVGGYQIAGCVAQLRDIDLFQSASLIVTVSRILVDRPIVSGDVIIHHVSSGVPAGGLLRTLQSKIMFAAYLSFHGHL